MPHKRGYKNCSRKRNIVESDEEDQLLYDEEDEPSVNKEVELPSTTTSSTESKRKSTKILEIKEAQRTPPQNRDKQIIIRKIEIEGFKSYNKKELIGTFSEDVNCIIGSNGSGKSNIVDAVCFVFGFDARFMRSKNLASLINHNAVEQKASVTIHFCIKDKTTSQICSKLSIRRCIHQNASFFFTSTDGVSYEKKPKTEVAELLSSFGIDLNFPERFIILQHNTATMIKKSPSELLDHLEVLTGTSTIKNNINLQMQKVSQLNQQILSQREELKNKEQRRVELEDNTSLFEQYKSQLIQFSSKKYKFLNQFLDYLKKMLKKSQKHIQDEEAELKSSMEAMEQITTQLRELEVKEQNFKNKQPHTTAASVESKLHQSKKQLANLLSDIRKDQRKLKHLDEELTAAKQSKVVTVEQLNKLEGDNNHILNMIGVQQQKMDAKTSTSTINSSFKSMIANLELQKQILATKQKEFQKLIDQNCEHNLNELLNKKQKLETKVKELNELEIHLHSLQNEDSKITQHLQDCITERENSYLFRHSLQNQLDNLIIDNKRKEQYKAYFQASNILKSQNKQIYGMLCELVTVKEARLLSVVNSILRESICNSFIVQTKQDALQVVSYFRESKIGSVNCFILNDIQITKYDRHTRVDLQLEQVISNLKYNKKLEQLVNSLLGAWYITQSDSIAEKLSLQNSLNIASTETGNLFLGNGEVKSARLVESFHFAIQTTEELQTTEFHFTHEVSSSLLSKKLIEINDKIATLDQKILHLERDASTTQSKINELSVKHHSVESSEKLQKLMNQVCASIVEAEKVSLLTNEQKVLLSQQIQNLESEIANMSKELETSFHNEYNSHKSIAELSKEISLLNEKAFRCKEEKTASSKLLESLQQKITSLEKTIVELNDKLELKQKQSSPLESSIDQLQNEFDSIKEAEMQFKLNLKQFKEQKDKLGISLLKEQNEIEKINTRLKQAREQIHLLEEKRKHSVGEYEKLTKSKLVSTNLIDEEEFELKDYEEMQEMEYEINQEEIELNQMKQQVDFKLVEEDLKLRTQIEDHSNVIESLESQCSICLATKKQLEANRYQLFKQTCILLNSNLSTIYKELSPGSDCYLHFAEEKEVAFQEGVVLMCRPDQSEWKPFAQLSGGQMAIIAVALSLSLQKAFPSPFFFCDEIDASLDIRNTEKVSKLLFDFATKNQQQVIAISLKPQFYENCNTLFGIYQYNSTSMNCKLQIC